MDSNLLNERAKFCTKIFMNFREIAGFVLVNQYFGIPVYALSSYQHIIVHLGRSCFSGARLLI